MAITVKKIELWNATVENRPGALARILEPLAEAGADLEVVMGTSMPGDDGMASIGVFPVKGRKAMSAARSAGLEPAASMPSLLVTGENYAGIGRQMSEALAQAGIDIGVAFAQVVGENFSALFGFAKPEDAARAATLLKKLGSAATKKPARTAGKPSARTRPSAAAKSSTKTRAAKPLRGMTTARHKR